MQNIPPIWSTARQYDYGGEACTWFSQYRVPRLLVAPHFLRMATAVHRYVSYPPTTNLAIPFFHASGPVPHQQQYATSEAAESRNARDMDMTCPDYPRILHGWLTLPT